MIELQQYTTFEDACVLAHRVKQQKKSKPVKKGPNKPFPKNHTFDKGSPQITHNPIGASSLIAHKTHTLKNKPHKTQPTPEDVLNAMIWSTLLSNLPTEGSLPWLSTKLPRRRR